MSRGLNDSLKISLTFLSFYTDAPNCTITRQDIEGEDTLICRADGYPHQYDYVWEFKSENETADEQLRADVQNKKSYLTLGNDFHEKRVYRCIANNTVGNGTYCEIQVAGHLLWWQTIDPPLYIVLAVIIFFFIAVIIICIIIIYICRNRRKRSSKSEIFLWAILRFSNRFSFSLFSPTGMEKSLVESKPNDPGEVSENYENLPFHGLQNVPANKVGFSNFTYMNAPSRTHKFIYFRSISVDH